MASRSKRLKVWISTGLCGVAILLSGCESKTPPKLAQPTTSGDASSSPDVGGPRVIGEVKISRAKMPNAIDASWLPSNDEVKGMLEQEIANSTAIELEPDTSGAVTLELQIAALHIAPPQEPEKLASAAAITLSAKPTHWKSASIERLDITDPMPSQENEKRAKLEKTLQDVITALVSRHTSAMVAEDALLSHIEGLNSVTIEQATDILERLRTRHRTTPYADADRARAVLFLKQLATRQEPHLLTAVFAGLSEFGATDHGPLLVEAATGASSRGEFPAFVALLSLMGDVHGPVVKAYLESVKSGHPDEAIRTIASESLARHPTSP